MSKGYAIVDLETTGLFPEKHDRIVEIGIVHVSPDGEVTGRWETLVNPDRDLGAQRIHGISAASVLRAPRFSDVAPRIAELLDGRVPVAHNASFDSRFLAHQMAMEGRSVASSDRWLCTMRLAASFLPQGPRSLHECCRSAGISQSAQHRAIADADATAALLQTYMRLHPDREWWGGWLASAQEFGAVEYAAVEWIARENAEEPPPSLLERIDVRVDVADDHILNLDYLALLDRVLLDRVVSVSEADTLVTLAQSLGVTANAAARMHQAYFDGVVSAAWADGEVTEAEWADVRAVASALQIPDGVVTTALTSASPDRPTLTTAFKLSEHDVVVITGETRRVRDEWHRILASRGIVPKDSITKATKLLVAADPDSLSGKAKKARQYGIPIVNEAGLERLLGLASD